jgi:hypothetical protein
MIEVVGFIFSVIGLIIAFQAPRQALLRWLPFRRSPMESGMPAIAIENLVWQRGLQTYELSFRLSNRNSAGTSAISRCIFLEVFAVRPHSLEIDKVFYGAPIRQVKGESSVYNIGPKVGLWELFREPRTFPANEVEDFHVSLRFKDGFAYAVRVGIDWYPLNDTENAKHRDVSEFVAVCSPIESRSAPTHEEEYAPPISFVNIAVPLANFAEFDKVEFREPANEA